jgi:hypothetical protein
MRLVWIVALLLFTPPAVAQDGTTLSIEGWRTHTSDGTVYNDCASPICAAGSEVSYKQQRHRASITLSDFEKHHRWVAGLNRDESKVRDVRISEVKERIIDSVRVLQVSRQVDWADNTTTFTIEARLIGPERSFSLVSDSASPEWTARNYEGFLHRLLDIAGIKSRITSGPQGFR